MFHDLAKTWFLPESFSADGPSALRQYSYLPGTDRLASWTGGSYSYNAAGCVTRIERIGEPTLDLVWNGQYHLVSVSTNSVFAESYAYDALGRRVSTTNAEGTVRHVYDDNWQCIADIDEQGNAVASYVWGGGIDNLLAVKIGEATYYALTDVQGTVWGYADSSNDVVARWTYDAWGNVLDESVSVPALATIRYRFQGREWSSATGLYNFRARWYDPETGRWLSKDPIGLAGGLNLYAFCGNNAINQTDPHGRFGLSIGLGGLVGGIVGAITGGIKGGLKGAIAGAVGGAVAGALTGVGAGAAIAGAAGGAATSLVDQLLNGKNPFSANGIAKMAISAGLGAGFGNFMAPNGRLGEAAAGLVGAMAGSMVEMADDVATGAAKRMFEIGGHRREKLEECIR